MTRLKNSQGILIAKVAIPQESASSRFTTTENLALGLMSPVNAGDPLPNWRIKPILDSKRASQATTDLTQLRSSMSSLKYNGSVVD